MPTIQPFSALPGLNPQSLSASVKNAVRALDRLTKAGFHPDSSVFAYHPTGGGKPSVGLGGALVVDAYAKTMPNLKPEALAKAIMAEGVDNDLASDFYQLGDPTNLCPMIDAVRIIGCDISSDFPRLFDGHESLWAALCPNAKLAGRWFQGDSVETPWNESWDEITNEDWGDLERLPVEFATPAAWKRARSAILTNAKKFGVWEESEYITHAVAEAHLEADDLIAAYYPND